VFFQLVVEDDGVEVDVIEPYRRQDTAHFLVFSPSGYRQFQKAQEIAFSEVLEIGKGGIQGDGGRQSRASFLSEGRIEFFHSRGHLVQVRCLLKAFFSELFQDGHVGEVHFRVGEFQKIGGVLHGEAAGSPNHQVPLHGAAVRDRGEEARQLEGFFYGI